MGHLPGMPTEPAVSNYKIIYTVMNKKKSPFLNDLNKNEQNGIIKYRNIAEHSFIVYFANHEKTLGTALLLDIPNYNISLINPALIN